MSDTPETTDLRIAAAGDRGALRRFLGRLSPGTLRLRYLGAPVALVGLAAEREAHRLLDRDPSRHVVVFARGEAEIRAIGEFVIDPSGAGAELGMVVEDAAQGQGIGQRLYGSLEQRARQQRISRFTGDVAYGNDRVLRWLRDHGRSLRLEHADGSVRFTLALDR